MFIYNWGGNSWKPHVISISSIYIQDSNIKQGVYCSVPYSSRLQQWHQATYVLLVCYSSQFKSSILQPCDSLHWFPSSISEADQIQHNLQLPASNHGTVTKSIENIPNIHATIDAETKGKEPIESQRQRVKATIW